MKLTGYLFCLSLAMASGVTPASAQHIYFNYSPVGNGCGLDLLLNPGGIGIPRDGGRVVEKARVEEVKLAGFSGYVPTRSMNVPALASCLFDQCKLENSIRLTCVGGLEDAQTVIFKWRKSHTRKR